MTKNLFGFTVTDDTESVHAGDVLELVYDPKVGGTTSGARIGDKVTVTGKGKLQSSTNPNWKNPTPDRVWKTHTKSAILNADGEYTVANVTNTEPYVAPGYEPLYGELINALNQSQSGKGKERHANDLPFLKQPIMTNGRQCGPGGAAMQVMKKTGEAVGMFNRGQPDRAIAELHGAIVYAAATILLIKETTDD